MIVISDTSPISNLLLIGRLQLLQQIYQGVIIPPIVLDELLELENFKIDINELKKSTWLEVKKLTEPTMFQQLSNSLDPGEAEAIALALELKATTLLIDEKRGRKIASQLGISTIGLLGVLLTAKQEGYIPEVKLVIEELIKIDFRVSTELIQRVLQEANELK